MEEVKRLAEVRARIRLAAEAQMREQAALDGARAFDTNDFLDQVGQRAEAGKNRWVAMQRVLLLSKVLPPASVSSLSRDWAKWDSTNRNDPYHFPTAASYALKYKKWMNVLLARLAEGRAVDVWNWWKEQMDEKVLPADVFLPALPPELLTSATYLLGAAPACRVSSEPRGSGS